MIVGSGELLLHDKKGIKEGVVHLHLSGTPYQEGIIEQHRSRGRTAADRLDERSRPRRRSS